MLSSLKAHFRSRFGKWRKEPLVPFLILCVAGGMLTFIRISDEMRENEYHAFDRWVLLQLREPGDPSNPLGSPYFESMVRDITALGGGTVLTGLTLASVGAAFFLGKRRTAALIAIAICTGSLLTSFLKSGFDRPRPDLVPHEVLVTSPSFPSGHAMMSAVVYITLGVLLARTQPRMAFRIYLISLAVFLALLVGLSRVYLGVHWPTDVLAGWALGAAWALLFQLLARRYADKTRDGAARS